jgi:UDP-3-O-[3-hydroxymyristoyl] N-acetylglucosamine deacetylase
MKQSQATQQTLKQSVTCQSVGVHSGAMATLTLKPAKENTGIQFIRTDITEGNNIVVARWDNVIDTMLCTVIANEDGVRVSTIEHLMSALLGCGVDNAIVEIDNEEVPIMDGSAKDFVTMIDQAGIQKQNTPRKAIRITKDITYTNGDKQATLKPADIASYEFHIDFSEKNKVIGKQSQTVQLVNGTFRHDIADARTFGLLEEVEHLKSIGLAKGGSLDNAIVVSQDKVMNPDGLRFDNEFVRHKILDAMGDLYLAGAPIIGAFEGIRAGHEVNNQILHVLFSQPDSWEWIEEEQTIEKQRAVA